MVDASLSPPASDGSTPPPPTVGEQRRACLERAVTALLLVTLLAVPAGLRAWAEIRPDVPGWLGGAPVDRTFTSPDGATSIRVVVTDRGGLGYGCLFVWRYARVTGWHRIGRHCEAVSSEPVVVTWDANDAWRVTFEDPNRMAPLQLGPDGLLPSP